VFQRVACFRRFAHCRDRHLLNACCLEPFLRVSRVDPTISVLPKRPLIAPTKVYQIIAGSTEKYMSCFQSLARPLPRARE
jgi:hypothetical protein